MGRKVLIGKEFLVETGTGKARPAKFSDTGNTRKTASASDPTQARPNLSLPDAPDGRKWLPMICSDLCASISNSPTARTVRAKSLFPSAAGRGCSTAAERCPHTGAASACLDCWRRATCWSSTTPA